jgi:hypothetical protein
MACHWIRLRNSADSADHQKSSRIDGEDNIPEPNAPGFEALQISPQAIEKNILPQMLQAARRKAEA